MRGPSALVAVSLLAGTAQCAKGIVGFGTHPYDLPCAHACQRSITSFKLSCSHDMEEEGHSHGPYAMTPPSCRAQDEPYLSTLAWCMHVKCSDVKTSQLQAFWKKSGTEDPPVAAMWDYPTALASSSEPSVALTEDTAVLNFTAIANEDTYLAQYNSRQCTGRPGLKESMGKMMSCRTSIMSRLVDKAKPLLVYPDLVGKYQVRPLPYRLGNAPTVGQALYMAIFTILVVIFCAVSYETKQPHAWFATREKEVTAYVFYRTGYLTFALMPLVLLFSSRNNVLLWVTNWSHSTFFLLHRWVARICALLAFLHTLLALPLYYPAEAKKDTLYEFFLASHIIFSVFVLVGCWYHIYYWLPLAWGYEVLFRLGRLIKAGMRRSWVVELGEGYLRIDVGDLRWGAEPGSHVYAYFPTTNKFRPWENHPPVPTESADLEKRDATQERTKAVRDGFTMAGVTLLVKKAAGATNASRLLKYDRLLLVAGEIGITGVIQYVSLHPNVKLCWSVKQMAECLVKELGEALHNVEERDVRVGRRLNVDSLFVEEAEAGWTRVGVVMSGPGGLCDDVRAAVVVAAKKSKVVFELEVDAYS
ncbi:hypothetical protein B0T18DRAFT_440770 [Schizothecium vesticola]|uniref:Ferric oxidoreductase domain-containing protein n=1 Tax=Schizothecium vesticola TaxID=314040 RepID=A0AA40K0Y1_9PEZI|nr:hypothetical protein B0T18DRAFT_440770 [Schizothecium vesticola]